MHARIAIIAGLSLLGMGAVVIAAWLLRRYLARAEAEKLYGQTSGRPRPRRHRALLASLIAAPGALPLTWGIEMAQFDNPVAVYLGWLPGIIFAALIAGLAYVMAEGVPRHHRTLAAVSIGAAFNVVYIALAATYLALHPV
jgi:MFS family permease